ncbi:MAG: PKD domain-containing protein, partial [Elusimicrobiota bacterium]
VLDFDGSSVGLYAMGDSAGDNPVVKGGVTDMGSGPHQWAAGATLTRHYPLYVETRTNQPAPGARVEIRDGANVLWSGATDPQGYAEPVVVFTEAMRWGTYDIYVEGEARGDLSLRSATPLSAIVNQPPTAEAGADQTVLAGAPVAFDGRGSFDPDGSIVSYGWAFGDGDTASGMTAGHTYQAAGAFIVTLTVTDDEGGAGADTAQVTVQDFCPADPDKAEPGLCGCGVPDADSDGDGTPDCDDQCPDDPAKTEAGACGCGAVDDADGDGVFACGASPDDCPAAANPDQADFDADGIGDVCDADIDGDGTSNEAEGDASAVVGSEGGLVEAGDVTVDLAAGAVAEPTTVTAVSGEGNFTVSTNKGKGSVVMDYQITAGAAGGATFNEPVTLVFHYDDTQFSNPRQEASLDVYWLDTLTGQWEAQGAVLDAVANTLTLETYHFSSFAVSAPADSDADGVFDDFDGEVDECLGSALDGIALNPNQYAQNADFGPFETGRGGAPSSVYDMAATRGCTCRQIAAALGAGKGHLKKGCSPGLMEDGRASARSPIGVKAARCRDRRRQNNAFVGARGGRLAKA